MTSPVSRNAQRPDAAPLTRSTQPEWAVYLEGVRLIALRALGDSTLADDVAQEAITRAMTKMQSLTNESVRDVGAFVYGIARHVIADIHRARGRTVALDAVEEPAEPRVDALAAVISDEERGRVRTALEQLSTSDRNILYLSFYEGLQPEEIAQRVREAAVRIRKRKSRALERLRRAFFGDSVTSR